MARRVPVVADNLIHKGEMPVCIGLFVNPGTYPGQPVPEYLPDRPRQIEYDTLSDRYVRLLIEEIIPEVRKDYNLTDDPNLRTIGGASSGGICAWTAAWERPDAFRKVLSIVGITVCSIYNCLSLLSVCLPLFQQSKS